MTDPHSHPLVASYVRELELLLGALAPGDRADVVAGVREHLDGSLGAVPSDEAVRSALARLGQPQAIADEAYAAAPVGTTPDGRAGGRRWSSRPFVPVVVGMIGFAVVALAALLAAVDGHPAEFVLLPVWLALPLVVMLVLVRATDLWNRAEKKRFLLAFGAGYLACALLSLTPPTPVARTVVAVLAFGAVTIVCGRLVVTAHRRARETSVHS